MIRHVGDGQWRIKDRALEQEATEQNTEKSQRVETICNHYEKTGSGDSSMVAKYRGSEFNEKQNICMVSKCPPTDRLWGQGE